MRLLLCAALLLGAPRPSNGIKAAQVSLLEGSARRLRSGLVPEPLKVGAGVLQGEIVETAGDSRVELRLPDASVLRLGPRARLQLTAAHFGPGAAKRSLSVKLFFGNIWARVTSVVTRDQRFQIETENAVAGVRGTTFRVDAHEDKSVLVRVYAGSVAVAKNAPAYARPGERREVPGPQEISRERWEKVVGRQMQILIAADGTPGEPSRFSEADEKDDAWAEWNRTRDEQGK